MKKKVCMLIGANSEIGSSISNMMSSDYQLVLVWHNNRDRIDQYKESLFQADIVQKDMTDENAVESLFKYVFDNYGRIDCVINFIATIWRLGVNCRDSNLYVLLRYSRC